MRIDLVYREKQLKRNPSPYVKRARRTISPLDALQVSLDVLLRAGLTLARPALHYVASDRWYRLLRTASEAARSPLHIVAVVRDQPRCFCHALPYWPSHASRNGRRRLVSGRMATGIRSAVAAATTVGLAINRTRDLFPPCLEPVRAAVNS
ncbi:hypothetical protein LZ31DRAFT_55467 [Colletotrichum somersetense]|nr:hypothetical protein LZ31DRAFT_55467 [Colletotrichum somersetense]